MNRSERCGNLGRRDVYQFEALKYPSSIRCTQIHLHKSSEIGTNFQVQGLFAGFPVNKDKVEICTFRARKLFTENRKQCYDS
jgi:hypothetical protein